jgi:hypothetical protein
MSRHEVPAISDHLGGQNIIGNHRSLTWKKAVFGGGPGPSNLLHIQIDIQVYKKKKKTTGTCLVWEHQALL